MGSNPIIGSTLKTKTVPRDIHNVLLQEEKSKWPKKSSKETSPM
jgi:hypothetical protein